MNIPLPTIKRDVPSVCKMLRTKNAFANYGDDSDVPAWQLGESETAVYWCLKTMQHAGPDDGFAHPHHCLSGRACYRSAEE
jgi:hypothetical protein